MIKTKTGRFSALCLLFVTSCIPGHSLLAADLLSIDKLIKQKQYAEAYQQASELEDELSGQPNFDFLYAISAIESGHPHRAIFTLERLVSQFPDNGRIKVELARAHFLAGDNKTAESLFKEVLETKPPENVTKKINTFLQLIEKQNLLRQSKWINSVLVSIGWDSNYNSAPDLNIVQIGGINFTLNENSRQQDTYYSGLDANISYLQMVNKKLAVNYGIYYQQRENIGNELDTQALGLVLSPIYMSDYGQFRFPLQLQQLNLDGEQYRQYASLGVEWSPGKQPQAGWTYFIQYGSIRYPDQNARDMNLTIIGTSYQKISRHGTIYQTALFYTDETSVLPKGEYNEVDSLGLRSYIKTPLSARSSLYGNITLQSMEYGKTHPVFNMLRKDTNAAAALGWEYKWNPVTYLKLEAEYLQNSSNIEIYDYDRISAFISLRYDF